MFAPRMQNLGRLCCRNASRQRHCRQHVALATGFRSISTDIVDLRRYPLQSLSSEGSSSEEVAEAQRIVSACRKSLETDGYLVLPRFLSEEGLKAAVTEAESLFSSGIAFRSSEDHNITLYEDESSRDSLPLQSSSKWLVAADQMPASSVLQQLYQLPWLLDFVSGILGKQVFHSADPMNCLHLNRFGPGDGLGWHHDNSEFFFNLLLQQPGSGGDFEYVVDSRDDEARQRAALEPSPPSGLVKHQPEELAAGGALVFRGRHHMHRVTPVVGDKPRLTAILNFASQPGGGLIEEYTRQKFFGRSLES
eukprot:TRINITY_DN36270_c0_g1_i1.p1 TRINITY_DN36270_c0_g1~~TRINITY_DN36270_c0_g1_i1.p1  ORF type:complete len:307 (+),score=46.74 TRINITY_DN36270_c0_g1_i1:83-1003(+)